MNVVTIHLHGFMAERYAPVVRLAGATIEQLMAGLKHRFGPTFKQDVADNDWHLVPGDITVAKEDEALSESDLAARLTTSELHLVPVFQAAKKFVQVIVGAVLVVAGVLTGNPILFNLGLSMVIGGVINLLFAPKLPNLGARGSEESGSYVFNGAVNITSQGGVKPIIAGRVPRSGAVIISTDFSTAQLSQNVDPGTGSTDVFVDDGYITDLPPGGV